MIRLMLWARFQRWCHQIRRLARVWRWRTEPPCCGLDVYAGPWWWKRYYAVGCTCGRTWGEHDA